jgi:hypothetical protein
VLFMVCLSNSTLSLNIIIANLFGVVDSERYLSLNLGKYELVTETSELFE